MAMKLLHRTETRRDQHHSVLGGYPVWRAHRDGISYVQFIINPVATQSVSEQVHTRACEACQWVAQKRQTVMRGYWREAVMGREPPYAVEESRRWESVAFIGAKYSCWSLKLTGLGDSRRWVS
jgi:hypothetical protein